MISRLKEILRQPREDGWLELGADVDDVAFVIHGVLVASFLSFILRDEMTFEELDASVRRRVEVVLGRR